MFFIKLTTLLMSKVITSTKHVNEILSRGPEEIVVEKALRAKMRSGKVLRVKHGMDPTSADLHLGYFVVYEKLRQFQEMGHKIVFLIGGFTGRFGDPTEKDESRGLRTKNDVSKETKNYIKQLSKILDIDKIEIRDNSEWFDKWSWEDGVRFMQRFTTSRMLERDMFARRMKAGKEIRFHEPVYPMLQGWDSVELKADLTVIGTDQKFNELVARDLQEAEGQKPQDLIMMPLLVGTDGKQKMSQSLGNHIGFDDKPADMFGKVMSLPDHAMEQYFTLATRVPGKELKEITVALKDSSVNPRDIKARLGKEIVSIFHGDAKALAAAKEFDLVFKEHAVPKNIPKYSQKSNDNLVTVLVESGLLKSKSEARRLIQQGGVKVNGEKVETEDCELAKNDVIRCGKKKFLQIQ